MYSFSRKGVSMELQAYPLNCTFLLDGISFHILQISRGTVVEVPSHSHGAGNYEIHYLPEGYGTAVINGSRYDIVPNTLYITGPLVEHSQNKNGPTRPSIGVSDGSRPKSQ